MPRELRSQGDEFFLAFAVLVSFFFFALVFFISCNQKKIYYLFPSLNKYRYFSDLGDVTNGINAKDLPVHC